MVLVPKPLLLSAELTLWVELEVGGLEERCWRAQQEKDGYFGSCVGGAVGAIAKEEHLRIRKESTV